MDRNSTRLIYLLTRNFLILVLIFTIGVSFYLNFVFNNKLGSQRLEIIKQDRLAESIVEINKNVASTPITYDNIPTNMHNYIDCINKGISSDELSGEIKNRIQRLNLFFSNHSDAIGFAYEDLHTGFSLGYRKDSKVFAASTTKAPLAIYAYMLADEGKLDLNQKYTYTSNYYADGTGIIKNEPVNSVYTLRQLIEYSIVYSDNIAYLMISDIVSKNDASAYFKELGAQNLYNSSNQSSLYQMFGEITPNDGNIYMKELYNYSLNNTNNSKDLINYFKNAILNNIREETNLEVAHKYGWTSSYVHDMALVFDENPYVITITTTMGDYDWSSFVRLLANKVEEIHRLYWNEVNNSCKALLS